MLVGVGLLHGAHVIHQWCRCGTVVPSSITTINTACSDVGIRSITTSGVATESGMGDAGDSSNLTCCGGGVATL